MSRIRPLQLGPDELLEYLTDHVEKFRLDTGIKARFFADMRQESLPPRMCNQVARLVQEALSNVRKHSGARRVDVRLIAGGGRWSLVIEDDGHGVARSHDAGSDAVRQSPVPAVIKECTRSLDADLTFDSVAGGGVRIEIRFSSGGALAVPQTSDTLGTSRPVLIGEWIARSAGAFVAVAGSLKRLIAPPGVGELKPGATGRR
jgi:signal transduction histidine kinase